MVATAEFRLIAGGTICAERTAIVKAVVRPRTQVAANDQTDGYRKFAAIGVATYAKVSRLL